VVELRAEPEGLTCLVCAGCVLPCLVCLSDGPVPINDAVGLVPATKAIFAAASKI